MGNEYKTKDLAEASALIIKGMNLIRLEREGSICWFIFEDIQRCNEYSKRFHFGIMNVNAREFYEVTRRLKRKIYI